MLLTSEVVKSFTLGKLFNDNEQAINALDFHHEGEFLVTSSDDESIRVYNVESGTEHNVVMSHKYGVGLISYTHHNNTVVCASKNVWDQTLRYLSLHDNKFLRYFRGHRDRVVSMAMCPTNDTFMSGSLDETIRLWDLRVNQCQGLLRLSGRPVVAFDPQGIVFAAGMGGGAVKLYDVRSFDKGPFDTFVVDYGASNPPPNLVSMAFSCDGKMLLLSTDQEPVYALDAYEGTVVHTLMGRTNATQTAIPASFSPDSQFIASGSEDGAIHVWDAASGESVSVWEGGHPEVPVPTASGDSAPVLVAWNPKKMVVASSCQTLGLWIPQTEE